MLFHRCLFCLRCFCFNSTYSIISDFPPLSPSRRWKPPAGPSPARGESDGSPGLTRGDATPLFDGAIRHRTNAGMERATAWGSAEIREDRLPRERRQPVDAQVGRRQPSGRQQPAARRLRGHVPLALKPVCTSLTSLSLSLSPSSLLFPRVVRPRPRRSDPSSSAGGSLLQQISRPIFSLVRTSRGCVSGLSPYVQRNKSPYSEEDCGLFLYQDPSILAQSLIKLVSFRGEFPTE